MLENHVRPSHAARYTAAFNALYKDYKKMTLTEEHLLIIILIVYYNSI